MGAIDFITRGGMANIAGDMPESEQKICNEFIKKLGTQVSGLGLSHKIPISKLSILQMNCLFVGKDTTDYFFVFIDKPGTNHIIYQDLSKYGKIPDAQISSQLELELGKVYWSIALPMTKLLTLSDAEVQGIANKYIQYVLTPPQNTQDSHTMTPDISKEMQDFKSEYSGKKTAFIIMQFSSTPAHDKIVSTIKTTLSKHNIIALRADDKEYADDLWANIRVYMHSCDFGIGIFERILQDNFNPNVSIEVGYMMGMRKNVCLLKDETLKNLPTDLMGKLYKEFDPQNIETTLPAKLEKWMQDKGII